MDTNLIVEELKEMEKYHGGSINHWFGGIIHITVQNRYDLQYLTMHLSGYINAPTEPAFLDLKYVMYYLMNNPK